MGTKWLLDGHERAINVQNIELRYIDDCGSTIEFSVHSNIVALSYNILDDMTDGYIKRQLWL